MIGTIDVNIQAARPDFPLTPFKAFVNSPSSVRVRNVPKKIGKWDVTKVFVSANYPDNTTRSAECALVGGVWVGTIVGSSVVGQSLNGYQITANGTDENGEAVTGYILGKGDVEILSTDGTITVGETTYYIHLLDSVPATPHKGDLCKITGVWKLYNGTQWETLGGGGGGGIEEYASREEFPATGTEGMLYLAKDTNKLYRWATELSPAAYAEVSPQTAVAWGDVTGKPESFPPSAHTHAQSDVNGLSDALTSKADASALTAEVNRATAAEATKATTAALNAEVSRATAAEAAAIAACVQKTGQSSQSVEGQLSVGALYVGGTKVEVVSAVPASPIADTLYFITGS